MKEKSAENVRRIILHVDANSAFLSWSAVDALEKGASLDLRTVPSVVGGDQESRHGIVLAKSVPAKAFGIRTAEPLVDARRKCPGLIVVPADRDLYSRCSRAMNEILSEYSPVIQKFSIDESFLDYTGCEEVHGPVLETAYGIKERIKRELGFTVNVGISSNRILAKMAGELKKPDMVHTLWPDEIEEKLHPLPVGDLFMVGGTSEKKLRSIGINTIGDLARMDRGLVNSLLKAHGDMIWRFANGIDDSPVVPTGTTPAKGVGNSMTISYDVTSAEDALSYILQLSEQVAMRLRRINARASVISVQIRTKDFVDYSRQTRLEGYTDSTDVIYRTAESLFRQAWRGEPIRLLGVHSTGLDYTSQEQISIFDTKKPEEDRKYDKVVDEIREKFGKDSLIRASVIGRKK
ncbi:MAG: DNA polymerase IV [Firmicutes bacterium]|nr:DNA polymerase IV [Bacillota bacterium]